MVLLNPHELAALVAKRCKYDLPPETIGQLAWAFANGQGVAQYGNIAIVVLAHPLDETANLKIIEYELLPGRSSSQPKPPEKVCDTFRYFCVGNPGRRPTGDYWFPASPERDARIWLGGRLPEPHITDATGRDVYWYQIHRIQVGDLFYYMEKRGGDLGIYQRISQKHFLLIRMRNPWNLLDLDALVAELAGGGEFTGIEPVPGSPTLLRPPPAQQ